MAKSAISKYNSGEMRYQSPVELFILSKIVFNISMEFHEVALENINNTKKFRLFM